MTWIWNRHGTTNLLFTVGYDTSRYSPCVFCAQGAVGYTITLVVSRGNKSITNGSKSKTRESKRTAATEGFIAMAYVNNILVAVFAEQFFGIQSAVLPASYNIPYFVGIIILEKLYSVQVHPVKN